LQKARYEAGEKKLSFFDICKELKAWRDSGETPWLMDINVQTMQHALKNLDRAYSNFFAKRANFPKFKKKGMRDGFSFPQHCKLDQSNNRVWLPKIGWVKYRNSQKVIGKVKTVTVSAKAGKWFVSILAEREVEQPVHPSNSIAGIDMGIARFATLSDGTYFKPLNSFRKHEKRLAKLQRSMARKVKFSNNWKKEKVKIQKAHNHISDARKDFLHKTSTMISKSHAVVCVEDLKVRNMSKSAAGTIEAPGRKVSAKSGLNKAILDQGWGEFRLQLEYKQAWRGGEVIAVPPRNTSRTCPACGHVSADNRQTQAEFKCVECGYENNADVVGAINVLRAGHARLACEVNDAVMSSAAGTHRSDSGADQSRV
jgi:putative transposase